MSKMYSLDFHSIIKLDKFYMCYGCRQIVKGKALVSFSAFGVPVCVCKSCAKNAAGNINQALVENETTNAGKTGDKIMKEAKRN